MQQTCIRCFCRPKKDAVQGVILLLILHENMEKQLWFSMESSMKRHFFFFLYEMKWLPKTRTRRGLLCWCQGVWFLICSLLLPPRFSARLYLLPTRRMEMLQISIFLRFAANTQPRPTEAGIHRCDTRVSHTLTRTEWHESGWTQLAIFHNPL